MNTCETCKCNKVCNHDKFGFENCGCYVPNEFELYTHKGIHDTLFPRGFGERKEDV
jgi:hypothetical protein